MKTITKILTTVLLLAIYPTSAILANESNRAAISSKKIKQMDRSLKASNAKRRTFRNQKEYSQIKRSHTKRHRTNRQDPRKQMRGDRAHRNDRNVRSARGRDRSSDRYRYYDDDYRYNTYERPLVKQRSYSDFKRGWYLAYLYDRASFNDRYGYHYGYFNRYGYYFDDVFYEYDRYYRYRDRVRGMGTFDRRYYMPSNYNYYGFCPTRR